MLKKLFLFAVLLGAATGMAHADSTRIYWSSDHSVQPETELFEILDKGRLLAKLAYAPEGAPGFLANQQREVIYFGAGIFFKPGTYFAAFPDLHPSGDPSRVLVLSDGGYWAFIRTHRLQWEEDMYSDEVGRAKALIETAPRLLSLANDRGAYLPTTQACNRARNIRDDEMLVLEAKPGLGIEAAQVPQPNAGSLLPIRAGYELTRSFFMEEGAGRTIEIIDRRPCGWERQPHPYDVSVSINGAAPIRIEPGRYEARAYPYDPSTNRAVISCREHRNSYFDYLIQELEIPVVFAPVVASLTGRWSRFEWFDNCEVR
ncbi:hypothetical protein [Pseudoprimorskyibacter insulae]|uniref:Uncharacterized protein n=1 Tax=Pseudoprimorskyibacter insulae TaxID=1695997 RepID=A0A2R8AXM0_9RHOB|nr:hypothetical protein [Pseudoprimorskyibacter insulae]SPF80773.1 hypothetical protein PRI8871_02585 [Pseudoprimorskyibacter insulae]